MASRPLIVAAPDSFKGSCSAADAAEAMLRGARSVWGTDAEYRSLPLADGGEGTLEAILSSWSVPPREVGTTDAIGRSRVATYALRGNTAFIESAQANGLPWVSDVALRPLDADSAGVGAIVLSALDDGATDLVLSLGGSATSDGGTGLLTALGVRFLDERGRPVRPGARGLQDIAHIDTSALDARARRARWRLAVDVDNPVAGPRGAAAVFGPQKGASSEDVATIEMGLQRFARVLAEHTGLQAEDLLERPGLGAAGGLALACVALLDAETTSGAEMVMEMLGAPALLARATLVLTGEGQLDHQSLEGKVIDRLRRAARCPIIVIAGAVRLSAEECRAAGIAAALSIARGPDPLSQLTSEVRERIADTSAHACALVAARA